MPAGPTRTRPARSRSSKARALCEAGRSRVTVSRDPLDDVVPTAEAVRRIDAELPLEPAAPNYRGEVARRWRFRDGQGRSA